MRLGHLHLLTAAYPEEKLSIFMTGDNDVYWRKKLIAVRPLYSGRDWERESESYLSECLHFKESALRSLRKQFLGGRFISQRAKKELKIARFLRWLLQDGIEGFIRLSKIYLEQTGNIPDSIELS